MGAISKRAKKVRSGSEFDVLRLASELSPPNATTAVFAWSLADIYAARNEQMLGRFRRAARLAESMRTDDALFVAYENRLAPQECISVDIKPAPGARGAAIAREAEALFGANGIAITPDTVKDIHGCLVNHGVAFAECTPVPREDGSRIDYTVKVWPIEWVYWDVTRRSFVTQTTVGTETITHGDGRWIVFQKNELEPWKNGCLLAAALVWARHAFASRDWAKGSVSHGSAKVVGEMPAGVPLQNADGLTTEAAAFLTLLKSIATGDAPVGIRPAGSKTEFVSNTSTAWQVWAELIANAERAAARIYLGTDGTLGTNGGAPGVDIASLFGVSTTKVQGDLKAIERGFATGLIEPWTAINFGDSALAPRRKYRLPDEDAEQLAEETTKANQAFFADVASARSNGFDVTREWIERLAAKYRVDAPTLPAADTGKAPTIALAPTDIVRVVSVNEARSSAGLGALLLPTGQIDPDGLLTVEEYGAKKVADTSAAAAAAPSPQIPQ